MAGPETETCRALLQWHRGELPAGRVVVRLNLCAGQYAKRIPKLQALKPCE